jgi:hypothetical protein
MRIFNKLGHTCFFPYAGSGKRGVNLKSAEQSPEIPTGRVNHPSLQNDLRRGRIGVLLSPSDKSALRGLVDDETMKLLEGAKAPARAEDKKPPLGKQMDARPPKLDEPQQEKADATYEKDAAPEKVDAVKEEMKAKTDMMTEEGKQETLDKLADSEQPSVAKAAEELKEESADADQEETDGGEAEPADDDNAAADADGDDAPADDDDSGNSAGGEPEPSGIPDPVPAKPKRYKGIAKAKLLSDALKRDLPATTEMSVKALRQMLVDDDANKAQG